MAFSGRLENPEPSAGLEGSSQGLHSREPSIHRDVVDNVDDGDHVEGAFLDRKLADRRIWPAIDITQSGTRREELLHDPDTLHAVTMLRRTLTTMHHVDAMEQLTRQLAKFKSNAEFIKLISGARVLD